MNCQESYLENEVMSLNREELITFTYRGLVRYLKNAADATRQGEVERRVDLLNRSMAVISYLRSILDMERGGEISQRLAALYDYSLKELVNAGFTTKVEPIEGVEKLMRELLSGWEEMSRRNYGSPSIPREERGYASGNRLEIVG
ncbi:MAG: Flagellar protein FliS [Candidatus Aminicenantes bacterium ADurb.Bin508]|nr:MAG: Flagellar protein FliS [Candidatus Aminicenantes bacterium ADurb.Bin508]HNX42191.1 flagellar export chaperone FliS [Candidatus Aminicenantes bacterium]HPB55902.1 flagellar export chaperone FliS [Candidatus Aminicenantes bacterium]HPT00404.1 flagellar export chaperone FliS [Candidatus Aminicenantes bacterium]